MPIISFLPFLQGIPPGTRILTSLLVLGTLSAWALSAWLGIRLEGGSVPKTGTFTVKVAPWLVLYPGESWRYPWVLLTAPWVEANFVELAISTTALILSTRYLERIWGFLELVRFSLIVVVISNVIAFGFSWIVWFVLGQEDALIIAYTVYRYGTPYHGLGALQIGFLVAFTQLIPEHQVQILGSLRIRVKTLPGIYLLISNVLILLVAPSPYMLVQFGFPVAWAYLRFFKLSEDGVVRGDRSEAFAFQYWFPPFVRPYINIVGGRLFKLAVRAGVVQHWDEPVSSGTYQMLPGPGGARAEAERRRAMALKALDARMASTSPAPGASSSSAAAATAGGSAAGPAGAAASGAPGVGVPGSLGEGGPGAGPVAASTSGPGVELVDGGKEEKKNKD